MGSKSIQKEPQIIEIEDDIIDLDGCEKTPEEVIYEWDAKIRKKLSTFALADNEIVLENLMKEYLESLQDMSRTYDDNETLKNKVFCHISFLYSYYVELQYCTPDNYLNYMEDLLTLYGNLELEVIRPLKKKNLHKKYKKRIVSVARKMIHVLSVFLLERHDHILHVLIKMNTSNISDSCSEVLNILYTHFLTKVPSLSLCDESFCRSYIVFQKWKEIRQVEDWEGMDKIMYKMFKRTPDAIKNSETLRQILMPASQSTVDVVLNLFRSFRDISNAYFKHVLSKKSIEFDDLDFNIDLGEDEPTVPIEDENEEEVTILKAYYEVERNMSNLSHATNTSDITENDILRKCKQEVDEDDDVQFVGIEVLPKQPVFDFEDDEEIVRRMSNINKDLHVEEEEPLQRSATPPSFPPNIPDLAEEEPPDPNSPEEVRLESSENPPSSCLSPAIDTQSAVLEEEEEIIEEAEPETSPSQPVICSIQEVISECELTNQPQVSLVSTNPPSPKVIVEPICEERTMKSVEVQADNAQNYLYNDYGLTTPPFDVPPDQQISKPVYANIGQSREKSPSPEREKSAVVTREAEVQVESTYNDFGLTPPNETDHGGRVQEPCLCTSKEPEAAPQPEFGDLDFRNQIDTGQKAPPFNGNTVLKPLPRPKVMFTSTQMFRAPLDDFSRFESAFHHQWSKMKEEILSGPIVPAKPPADADSRSSSPNDMTSPAYEAIDDFRNYFSDSVNGRVPPPHEAKVPRSILKSQKRERGVTFREGPCDVVDERRVRSDGVLVLKRVRRDPKLNMKSRVVVKRLAFIESKMKKVLNQPPTLRVDYDKTTPHLNDKDVVRCTSPPKFSWIVNLTHGAGSLTVKTRESKEEIPRKRKFEPQNNSVGEPVIRKRAFRTPQKKPLAPKGVRGPRKRKNSGASENNFVSKSDSEFDKLLNSGAYSSKPFRLDLTS